jgi:hypothetical protein
VISSAQERELFAVVVDHERMPKANVCRTCGAAWPCQPSQDARRALVAAGVDMDQAIGTIWS